jgi:hypothetical protein
MILRGTSFNFKNLDELKFIFKNIFGYESGDQVGTFDDEEKQR